MLAFIQDNQIEKYPVSLGDLKERFPNTSFTLPLNASDLADYGVVGVETLEPQDYDTETQRLELKEPEYIDGKWVVGYSVIDIPQEELDANRINLEIYIRKQRNDLLRESDWTQLPTGPLTQEQKDSWETYRQELRDITTQEGFPSNVIWPTI